jgi:hypothetical protein
MLSKSQYTRGTNCHKSLWLYKHKRNEQRINGATKAIFARGTSIGELAQQFFPNGKMAFQEDYPGYESAKRTQELIEQGVETIYEATFIFDNTLVAVDILHKENGQWSIYEVKSTNSTKPQHVIDVAIQYYVVAGSGLQVDNAYLMHFNRDYVRMGDIDVKQLFTSDSILNELLQKQEEVKANIPILLSMLLGQEPSIEMGRHCHHPYECDFQEYCRSFLPKKEPVVLSSKAVVNEKEVSDYVNAIEYPICHLDFETIMPGVPMFDESRPYQQIPFQYSVHFQECKDGEVKHYEYLAPSDINVDPRLGLIERMIEDTKEAKTVFVYSIAFERTRINELIRDFPQYKEPLESINNRMVDLIIPFRRKYYRTQSMEGSSSIKKVLPALCPELSYHDLEISDGMAASNSFLDLYYCDDEQNIQHVRQNLLKYCGLDTLAMVKILEVLRRVK